MALTSPIVLKLTTSTAKEDLFENQELIKVFPYLSNGGSLSGKLTLFFNGDNKVMLNNDGLFQNIIEETVWDSGGDIININSIKIEKPATLTMYLDFK